MTNTTNALLFDQLKGQALLYSAIFTDRSRRDEAKVAVERWAETFVTWVDRYPGDVRVYATGL